MSLHDGDVASTVNIIDTDKIINLEILKDTINTTRVSLDKSTMNLTAGESTEF